MSEIERRAQDKFTAAILRRRLTLQNTFQDEMRAVVGVAALNSAQRRAASQVAALARQARRDGMADIAELRRQVEQQWSADHAYNRDILAGRQQVKTLSLTAA